MSAPNSTLSVALEKHIRNLKWSADTNEETKAIVAGNLRHAFDALHVHQIVDALIDQMDPITRCVEHCIIDDAGRHTMACKTAREAIDALECAGEE